MPFMARGSKRVARPALNTRKQIRTTAAEWDAWESHARDLGFVGVAPWLRRVANEAVAAHAKAVAAEVAAAKAESTGRVS